MFASPPPRVLLRAFTALLRVPGESGVFLRGRWGYDVTPALRQISRPLKGEGLGFMGSWLLRLSQEAFCCFYRWKKETKIRIVLRN